MIIELGFKRKHSSARYMVEAMKVVSIWGENFEVNKPYDKKFAKNSLELLEPVYFQVTNRMLVMSGSSRGHLDEPIRSSR